jgi:membrane protein DedA with SNARE-associated domain
LPTTPALLDLVAVHGPWLLFLLALLETSFVTGLVVPSGVATSLATAVAVEQGASLLPVALAAIAGGAIGDSLGFWIGRVGRMRWQDGTTGFARRVRHVRAHASGWLGGHPFVSVTLARLVSFVRTVMPMVAGMSDLRYRRYVAYDAPGVLAWCALYMTAGAAAGEGWGRVTDAFGMGGALLLVGLVTGAIWLSRHRRPLPAGRRTPRRGE